MIKSKMIISALTVGTLVIGMMPIGFAANIDTSLNFDECYAVAQKASVELATYDSKLILAQRALTNANTDKNNADPSSKNSEADYLEAGKKLDLYPVQKQREYDDLVDSKNQALLDLKLELIAAYADVYANIDNVLLSGANIASLEKEVAIKKAEFKKGRITETALNEFEINLEDQKIALEKVKLDYKLAQMELDRILGYPLDTEVVLTKKLDTLSAPVNVNLTDIIAKAKVSSPNVTKAKLDYDMAKLEFEVTGRYYRFTKPSTYDSLEDKLPDYKKTYDNSLISEEVKVRSDYNNLQNLYNDVRIAKLKYDIANKNYTVDKLKASKGMITGLVLSKSLDNLRTLDDNVTKANVAYYKAMETFNNYVERLE